MLFFKNNQEKFKPSFFIAFLCGVKYKSNSPEDKRNVLYDYLKQNRKIKPVILEKSFDIDSFDNINTLNYKDIDRISSCYSLILIFKFIPLK